MKNCLLKEFYGSVDNNSLPELNTMYFDYPGGYGTTSGVQMTLIIVTGATGIDVTVKVPLHKNNPSGETVSEVHITPNTMLVLCAMVDELGHNEIKEFLKISGGIYDLVKLLSSPNEFAMITTSNPTTKNSLKSLRYASSLIAFGGVNLDFSVLPNTLKALVVGANTSGTNPSIDGAPNTVQFIDTGRIVTVAGRQFVPLTDATKNLTGLRIMKGRFDGLISKIPTGIKVIEYSHNIIGKVEDFVAAAVANGVTSGCIALPTGAWQITYNNGSGDKAITDASLNLPTVGGFYYMSWNNSTITWETSQPASMKKYVDAYNTGILSFVPFEE